METLIRILLRGFSVGAVNSSLLPRSLRGLANAFDRRLEFRVEFLNHRISNAVAQVPGSDEEDVNTGYTGDFLDLDSRHISILCPFMSHMAS